jgi:hypothetical protein
LELLFAKTLRANRSKTLPGLRITHQKKEKKIVAVRPAMVMLTLANAPTNQQSRALV